MYPATTRADRGAIVCHPIDPFLSPDTTVSRTCPFVKAVAPFASSVWAE
jgi:hypothetical protein